jgi:hypothetical protein
MDFDTGGHGNGTEPGAVYGGVTIPCQTIANRYIGMNWGWEEPAMHII